MGLEILPPEQPVWVSRCCPDECVKERDELQRRCESYKSAYDAILADLRIMEQKLNDLQVENSRLIRIGEERHIRAKDTEEGLMEHVERQKVENERLRDAEALFSSMCEALFVRMTRCRMILTNDNPTQTNNWEILDVTLEKQIFDEAKAALREVDGVSKNIQK